MGAMTVRQAADELDRSDVWLRTAIKLGKLKAEKFGKTWIIQENEVARAKKKPFTISRKEMG